MNGAECVYLYCQVKISWITNGLDYQLCLGMRNSSDSFTHILNIKADVLSGTERQCCVIGQAQATNVCYSTV